ncbi:aspartate aminotransferase [Desulfonatronum thiosulfatophilum]|uniref:Aminotransferase n=1 Tax=Desulfonatronum thiosulfatophilum TaxID=617002 RepID=A0A1G6ER19_9BACT|nr:pyridoxal phosphate-dependent aminotransferase [Desulfonatronum thiosulfatophilum]SDB59818.1 aspartate aminotransferase [Desulfonatronum thiosulfatophilum]
MSETAMNTASALAPQIQAYLQRSSWIRKMFETGAELKARHGADAVCDFSLGNPDLSPPDAVYTALEELARRDQRFGYMPNAGYPEARTALAGYLSDEQGTPVSANDVILTCGAAGALNSFFRAVLEPGDEVLCPAPYFVEYGFYAENHGGVLHPVSTNPDDFSLDMKAMADAINPKSRVLLINSPNNPSGRIYTKEELQALSDLLAARSREFGRTIYLLSDEPYRFLTFDDHQTPSLLPLYPHTVVVSSFSKSLALAGERIGFALVNPAMPGKDELLAGMVLTNRILGFVNAPAVGQRLMQHALGAKVDVQEYARRRSAMAEILEGAGISFFKPQGAFYFFPKAPGGDDVAFVQALQEELILAVPGRGFGTPGYFRLAFCVDETVIRRAGAGFKKAAAKFR